MRRVAAKTQKNIRWALPNSDRGVHNARPATVMHRPGGKRQKKISQGVDGRGICCKMCGSLDHFGGKYETR
ncbi:hypothetical protein, partial [Lysobacter koreensis]|uniref:hypothetical protein n=1 Tax=Lysobacter koreensis TaxID=266122 RepID=UPI0036DAE4B5